MHPIRCSIIFLSLNTEHNRQSDAEILMALQNCISISVQSVRFV